MMFFQVKNVHFWSCSKLNIQYTIVEPPFMVLCSVLLNNAQTYIKKFIQFLKILKVIIWYDHLYRHTTFTLLCILNSFGNAFL